MLLLNFTQFKAAPCHRIQTPKSAVKAKCVDFERFVHHRPKNNVNNLNSFTASG